MCISTVSDALWKAREARPSKIRGDADGKLFFVESEIGLGLHKWTDV